MANFWPLHHYNQCMGENRRKTLSTARGRGGVSTWYFHQIQVGMWAKLWVMSHLFVCFVALVIQGGAMAKFWPLHHYNQCMGENRRKTLSTARGRGGVSTWYFHQIQVGMWAKLWDMSHLFVCFVALVIQGGAMAKFWPLHHYNQCMGENRRKTLSTARGRGGVSTWYFHQIQVGMWAKLWVMSHLFVCFVALVIQGGAMAKFWPLHHYNQCMGENRRKTLSTARGRGGVSTWYFHQIQVGMWAKLWDMSHLFVCFVALVIQGGAMAKFWPLHHYNQCMGENRRKTLSTARGRGGVSTWYFHQIQVGMWAKLWVMSHLFVCFVALVIQGGAMAKFWALHHYNQCMGENRRKTLSTARGRGGVSTWYFHQIQVGMWAKLWDMSHLFVCFVALVIQSGAMAKFWALHHYNQCMGENRRKTLSTARGRGGVSTWYFHQIQVGMWAKLWDMSHLFVCMN